MRESLAELYRELDAALAAARDAAHAQRWLAAREGARRILSAGSKLHARLGILSEMDADAKFVAEAEHAAQDARQKYPLPLPGDVPLPFPTPEEPPPPRRVRGKK